MPLQTAPGHPAALSAEVTDLERTTSAIQRASDSLRSLAIDGRGQSMNAVRDRAVNVSNDLLGAHHRYSGTSQALRTYVVELKTVHAKVEAAVNAEFKAQQFYNESERDVWVANARLDSARANPTQESLVPHYENQLNTAYATLRLAESRITETHRDHAAAMKRLDEAARTAIAQIKASFDGTNDGAWDHISNAFSLLGEAWNAFTEWVSKVFKEIMQVISDIIAVVLIAIAAVVILALAVAILVVVLAVALALIPLVLAAALVLINTVVLMILAGVTAYFVATALGLDGQARLLAVVAAVAFVCPAFGAFVVSRIASDVFGPTPEVKPYSHEYGNPDLTAEQIAEMAQAHQDLNDLGADSVAELVTAMDLVDKAGKGEKAVVDIVRTEGPDGEDRWIVTLPSTQDWVVGSGDQPAPNDLDGNLALMLLSNPLFKTQYERAVLQAMQDAGIEPGAHVMFAGFSQGGIMAAHMASTHHGTYQVGGVLTAGAPIDFFNINKDIPVVSIEHQFDLVPRLDLMNSPQFDSNRITVTDGTWSAGGKIDVTYNPISAHNAALYSGTAGSHDADGVLSAQFSDFLGPVQDRQQFQFSE